jgi:hypothetical protein
VITFKIDENQGEKDLSDSEVQGDDFESIKENTDYKIIDEADDDVQKESIDHNNHNNHKKKQREDDDTKEHMENDEKEEEEHTVWHLNEAGERIVIGSEDIFSWIEAERAELER